MNLKSLCVTSVERYSGKTATCLALGRRFQADGYRVGYLKPVSLQPYREAGYITDEDAVFVKYVLGLGTPTWQLSPVVITPEFLRERLRSPEEISLIEHLKTAAQAAGVGKDILLLEGGASLREGEKAKTYIAKVIFQTIAEEELDHIRRVKKIYESDAVSKKQEMLGTRSRKKGPPEYLPRSKKTDG